MPGWEIQQENKENKDLGVNQIPESVAKKMEDIDHSDLAEEVNKKNITLPKRHLKPHRPRPTKPEIILEPEIIPPPPTNIDPEIIPDPEDILPPPPPWPTKIDSELSESWPTTIDQNENTEYTREDYEKDRNIVFNVIRRNWGFKENYEYYNNVTWTKEKWDNFVKENYMMLANPEQIRKRVIVQNNLITKNNFINHKNDPVVDVNGFMKTFVQEQEKLRTKYTEKIITNKPVMIKWDNQIQEVGKFIEISENNKDTIKSQLNTVIESWQEIVGISIIWKADSTWPKNDRMEFPWEQVKNSLKKLEDKGFDITLIKNVELMDGKIISIDDFRNNKEDKDKVNQTWAYARALMQFDFLSKEQLSLLQNSQSLKIKIDPQTVGDESKKWNEYTGGDMEITTKGNERIEKEKIVLPLKEINSPILFFHININNTKNWILDLVYRDNKLELEKSRDNKTSVWLDYLNTIGDSNIANYSPAKYDFGNLTLNLNLTPEDIWLIDTKEVNKEMPLWQQRLNQYENIKAYNEKSNIYFDSIKDHPEDFIKLLNVYKEKTNNPDEKKYIEWVITTINGLNS